MAPREVRTVDTEMQGTHQLGRLWQEGAGGVLVPVTLSGGSEAIPTGHVVARHVSGLWMAEEPTGGSGGGGGVVAQVVNFQTGDVASGSTAIPIDDTIPQNTEGDEYMTLVITPVKAGNKLRIDVVFNGSSNTSSAVITVALFQDGAASALAAMTDSGAIGTNSQPTVLTHYMTAGTTSPITFKVRAGVNAGTLTFNGQSAARRMGGAMASSITVTEIDPTGTSGGSSGGSSGYESYPAGSSASALDRDFNDSADLNDLTLFNFGSGIVHDVNVGVPGAWAWVLDGSLGTPGKGFLQSFPAGAGVIEYVVSADGAGTDYPFWGIQLAAGAVAGNNARHLCFFRESNTWVVYLENGTINSPSGIVSGPVGWGGSNNRGMDVIVRAERVGTTWTFSYRYPGTKEGDLHIFTATEAALGFAVTHAGMSASSGTVASKLAVALHSIRYSDDPTASFGAVSGSGSVSVEMPLRPSALPYTTDLAFHHRPDIGVTRDADNRVSLWSDPAFTAKDVAQATAINKPIWDPTAINGRPGLRFKRNQWLGRTGSAAIAATDNYTFFVVCRADIETGVSGATAFCNGSVGTGISLLNGTNEGGFTSWGKVAAITNAIAWHQTNSYHKQGGASIICIQRAAGTTTIYRDDGVLSPTFATTPNMPTQHWVGWDGSTAGRTWDGVIGDIIGFNASLAAADREAIMRYLGVYYGIPTYV
jgi:hypothetical protein